MEAISSKRDRGRPFFYRRHFAGLEFSVCVMIDSADGVTKPERRVA